MFCSKQLVDIEHAPKIDRHPLSVQHSIKIDRCASQPTTKYCVSVAGAWHRLHIRAHKLFLMICTRNSYLNVLLLLQTCIHPNEFNSPLADTRNTWASRKQTHSEKKNSEKIIRPFFFIQIAARRVSRCSNKTFSHVFAWHGDGCRRSSRR